MKYLILILALFIEDMNTIKLENLLGKNIEEAKRVLKTDFINHDATSFPYLFFSKFDNLRKFYKTTYRAISIELDDSKKIKSITIHFTKYVADDFYNSFVSHYDTPSNIYVIKNSKKTSELIDYNGEGEVVRRISKGSVELREGTFEENPLFILWKKKEYQIKILNRQGSLAGSDLIYSLPEN